MKPLSGTARLTTPWWNTDERTPPCTTPADPSRILQLGEGFMASKTLLSAVELELFTKLSDQALTGAELAAQLSLHPRAIPDFPDTLLALGLLDRAGDGPDAKYSNTPETAAFLDKASPYYLGGVLDMCNTRLYQFWGDLTDGLRTGASPERSETHRKVDVRRALPGPRQTRTVHASDERRLPSRLRRARREVRLQPATRPCATSVAQPANSP